MNKKKENSVQANKTMVTARTQKNMIENTYASKYNVMSMLSIPPKLINPFEQNMKKKLNIECRRPNLSGASNPRNKSITYENRDFFHDNSSRHHQENRTKRLSEMPTWNKKDNRCRSYDRQLHNNDLDIAAPRMNPCAILMHEGRKTRSIPTNRCKCSTHKQLPNSSSDHSKPICDNIYFSSMCCELLPVCYCTSNSKCSNKVKQGICCPSNCTKKDDCSDCISCAQKRCAKIVCQDLKSNTSSRETKDNTIIHSHQAKHLISDCHCTCTFLSNINFHGCHKQNRNHYASCLCQSHFAITENHFWGNNDKLCDQTNSLMSPVRDICLCSRRIQHSNQNSLLDQRTCKSNIDKENQSYMPDKSCLDSSFYLNTVNSNYSPHFSGTSQFFSSTLPEENNFRCVSLTKMSPNSSHVSQNNAGHGICYRDFEYHSPKFSTHVCNDILPEEKKSLTILHENCTVSKTLTSPKQSCCSHSITHKHSNFNKALDDCRNVPSASSNDQDIKKYSPPNESHNSQLSKGNQNMAPISSHSMNYSNVQRHLLNQDGKNTLLEGMVTDEKKENDAITSSNNVITKKNSENRLYCNTKGLKNGGNRRCHDIKDKYGSKISKTRKACIWFRDKNSISSLIPDDISNYLDAMVNSSLPFPSTAQEGKNGVSESDFHEDGSINKLNIEQQTQTCFDYCNISLPNEKNIAVSARARIHSPYITKNQPLKHLPSTFPVPDEHDTESFSGQCDAFSDDMHSLSNDVSLNISKELCNNRSKGKLSMHPDSKKAASKSNSEASKMSPRNKEIAKKPLEAHVDRDLETMSHIDEQLNYADACLDKDLLSTKIDDLKLSSFEDQMMMPNPSEKFETKAKNMLSHMFHLQRSMAEMLSSNTKIDVSPTPAMQTVSHMDYNLHKGIHKVLPLSESTSAMEVCQRSSSISIMPSVDITSNSAESKSQKGNVDSTDLFRNISGNTCDIDASNVLESCGISQIPTSIDAKDLPKRNSTDTMPLCSIVHSCPQLLQYNKVPSTQSCLATHPNIVVRFQSSPNYKKRVMTFQKSGYHSNYFSNCLDCFFRKNMILKRDITVHSVKNNIPYNVEPLAFPIRKIIPLKPEMTASIINTRIPRCSYNMTDDLEVCSDASNVENKGMSPYIEHTNQFSNKDVHIKSVLTDCKHGLLKSRIPFSHRCVNVAQISPSTQKINMSTVSRLPQTRLSLKAPALSLSAFQEMNNKFSLKKATYENWQIPTQLADKHSFQSIIALGKRLPIKLSGCNKYEDARSCSVQYAEASTSSIHFEERQYNCHDVNILGSGIKKRTSPIANRHSDGKRKSVQQDDFTETIIFPSRKHQLASMNMEQMILSDRDVNVSLDCIPVCLNSTSRKYNCHVYCTVPDKLHVDAAIDSIGDNSHAHLWSDDKGRHKILSHSNSSDSFSGSSLSDLFSGIDTKNDNTTLRNRQQTAPSCSSHMDSNIQCDLWNNELLFVSTSGSSMMEMLQANDLLNIHCQKRYTHVKSPETYSCPENINDTCMHMSIKRSTPNSVNQCGTAMSNQFERNTNLFMAFHESGGNEAISNRVFDAETRCSKERMQLKEEELRCDDVCRDQQINGLLEGVTSACKTGLNGGFRQEIIKLNHDKTQLLVKEKQPVDNFTVGWKNKPACVDSGVSASACKYNVLDENITTSNRELTSSMHAMNNHSGHHGKEQKNNRYCNEENESQTVILTVPYSGIGRGNMIRNKPHDFGNVDEEPTSACFTTAKIQRNFISALQHSTKANSLCVCCNMDALLETNLKSTPPSTSTLVVSILIHQAVEELFEEYCNLSCCTAFINSMFENDTTMACKR